MKYANWLFLDHLPISGGGTDSHSSEPHGPESEKSNFLEEDLILLIAKWKWCWQAKYYIERYLHFCLFVLNKRRLWDITPILEISRVYSDLYNSLDLTKLQLWVSHCGWHFMMCVPCHSLRMEKHTRNVSNKKHTLLVLRLFPGKPKSHRHLGSQSIPRMEITHP